ncbi:MAG: 50S ribosomal protein L1, partial [Verrucomicrobiota bacterium]
AAAVNQFKAGRVEFKMDRQGNLMMPFGKTSFSVEALAENCRAAIDSVRSAKPAAAKGVFIKRCTVTSTMGPGIYVDNKEVAA